MSDNISIHVEKTYSLHVPGSNDAKVKVILAREEGDETVTRYVGLAVPDTSVIMDETSTRELIRTLTECLSDSE